ncbi:SEL1-like repeat protein [Stappia sp.]|uniref:SEL1-like repeat protein n=1 Tax=Stappia sp. TaxID=1870903 RepID=UPI003A99F7A4
MLAVLLAAAQIALVETALLRPAFAQTATDGAVPSDTTSAVPTPEAAPLAPTGDADAAVDAGEAAADQTINLPPIVPKAQNGEEDIPVLSPPVAVQPPLPLDVEGETRDYAYGAFQRGWYLTALSLATPRAEAGDTAAQTLLGVLYETGHGVPRDARKAASWYELAAKGGNIPAALRYGLMLLNGIGVEQDNAAAGDMFEIAAKAGISEAIYNLAGLHRTGEGRPFDPDKALELLQKAAELGDVDARFQLAQFHLDGPADIRDEGRAAFWMGRAARQGHVGAQVRYAILRFNGRGVAPDEAEAADWFERAATAGNPVAMNRLARLYAFGRGRPVDLEKAAGWHLAARALGISDLELDGVLTAIDEETRQKAESFAQGYSTVLDTPAPESLSETP